MRRVDTYPPLWRYHKVRRTHNRDTPRYSATSLGSPEITPDQHSGVLHELGRSQRLGAVVWYMAREHAVTSRPA